MATDDDLLNAIHDLTQTLKEGGGRARGGSSGDSGSDSDWFVNLIRNNATAARRERYANAMGFDAKGVPLPEATAAGPLDELGALFGKGKLNLGAFVGGQGQGGLMAMLSGGGGAAGAAGAALAPETMGLSLLLPMLAKQAGNGGGGSAINMATQGMDRLADVGERLSDNFGRFSDVFKPIREDSKSLFDAALPGVNKMASGDVLGGAMDAISGMNPLEKLPKMGAAVANVTADLIKLPISLHRFGTALLEESRHLEDVSGAMAQLFAERDVQELLREQRRGGMVADSARFASEGNQQLKNQTLLLEVLIKRIEFYGDGITERIASFFIEVLDQMAQQFPLLKFLVDAAKAWLKKQDGGGSFFDQWVRGIHADEEAKRAAARKRQEDAEKKKKERFG